MFARHPPTLNELHSQYFLQTNSIVAHALNQTTFKNQLMCKHLFATLKTYNFGMLSSVSSHASWNWKKGKLFTV